MFALKRSPDTPDRELIAAVLDGSESAFAALVDRYKDRIFRLLGRYCRDAVECEDLAQDVFLKVFRKLHTFQHGSSFFTWLYRITANRSIDLTRSRKSHQEIEVDQPFLEAQEERLPGRSSPPDPSLVAQGKELEDKLAEAVERLPEKHRIVFLLHAKENLSYRQIAEVVQCNIGTVMSRLFYARKKLQEQLRLLGVEPPFISERAG